MKKFTFIAIFATFCFLSYGQNMLSYSFKGNLAESNNNGPVLTVLGNQGTFVTDTLNEINHNTRTVYRFENNSGFQFNNSQGFVGESYTIELYFVFDDLTSWKRVIDWKNRKTDYGAYVYYGQLNFYNIVTSEDAPVVPGEYTYYVVTRDAATKNVIIYTDAIHEIDFIDDGDNAVIDEDHVLNFFHDDLVVPNESSSGAVALLNIYNYVLDTTAIREKWNNINGQIFGVSEHKGNDAVRLYPNPVKDHLTVDLSSLQGYGTMTASLISGSGTKVYTGSAASGTTTGFDLTSAHLSSGIYLLRLESEKGTFIKKVIVE